MLAAEELIALVDALRQANFKVSTQQLLAAQELLLKLATRGSLPDDPQKLSNWLRPIFCTNPQEQEAFPELFRQWLIRNKKFQKPSPPKPPLKRHKYWIRILFAILVTIIGSILLFRAWYQVISHSDSEKLKNRMQKLSQIEQATSDVVAEITSKLKPEQKPKEPERIFIEISIKKAKKEFDEAYKFALALSPLALYLLGLLVYGGYRYFLRRAVLRKLATAEQPDLRHIQIPGVADWAFGKQAFRRLLQILHQHRTVATDRLDAAASVQATINNGGLFSPVYGARKAVPEYLALVDRLGVADAQATLADSLLDRLASGKLFVDRYQFHADPRLCRKASGVAEQPAPSLTLKELGARYGGHALLVFSDAGGFINPYSGALKPGVEQLRSWPERVLFSPEAGAESFTQMALEPLDFKLTLPLSQAGLSALATRLQQGDTPLQARSRQQLDDYPRLLQQSTARWLERLAPRPEITEKLCLQLKDYLGEEGYQWLCACAIYPLLVWDMTLFLGGQLGLAAQPLNNLLPRLVRLPWLRHGSMPDWLRARLLQALPDKTQQRLREALLKLLTIEPKPNQAVTLLDIAVDKPPRFWQRWQNRLKLQAKVETAPDDSPLRDYVFLSFMAGRRIDPLHLQAPQRLQRLERLRNYKVVGVLGLLVLAATVSLVCFWLQPLQTEQRRVEIPAMVDIPGGNFQMGCVENNQDCKSNEKPVHEVSIAPFQLGAYEVTVTQFRVFIEATGYQTTAEQKGSCWSYYAKRNWHDVQSNSWRNTGYAQTDQHPVTCISWEDAQAYLGWLSQQTQEQWRLPSEVEWEYAARAGTKTGYSWGDQPPVCDLQVANGAQFRDCKEKTPVSVGSFSANPFGLYDMHGNVWEWVEDCWQDNYDNVPLEGKAYTDCGKNSSRVLRGGSWYDASYELRSAYRYFYAPDDRYDGIGFRAAKTSNPLSINNASAKMPEPLPSTIPLPAMVKIPAGKFMMGCVAGRDDVEGGCSDNEKLPHEVNVPSFSMSETEVTVEQYLACVQAGACPKPAWQEQDAPSYYKAMGEALTNAKHPIVGVSWDNAQVYVKWLSQVTGKQYRLPSEAEWEYAARAGTKTAYSWGNAIGKANANCDNADCFDPYQYTASVGSFAKNPFGLYDMHGNVWEWVEDCWQDSYDKAPLDGKARSDCDKGGSSRVLRGGSWLGRSGGLRSANRLNSFTPGLRNGNIGFRAARTD